MTLFTVVKGVAKVAKWGAIILGTSMVLTKVSIEVEDALEQARKEQEEIIEKRGYKEPIADKVEVAVKVVKETGFDIFMGITTVVTYFGYESAAIDRWAERRLNDQMVADMKRLGRTHQIMARDCFNDYDRADNYTEAGRGFNAGCAAAYFDSAKDFMEIAKKYERRTK